MDLQQQLTKHFQGAHSTPFLFVGSGFSRRYIGLEDWKDLLARFCAGLKSFDYYLSTANADLSEAANLIALDFHELWWNSPQYEVSREKNKSKVRDKSSALRIEIANYLTSLSLADLMASEYREEIEILSRLNVDGIITTNWDLLLEKLFPDYRVYVGQSELLFSNPQSIAEIYKIHGSAARPMSLVLTKADYDEFDEKNPYLAAKLITLFVEHPIVFIGYSLTDKNIGNLLKAIVSVLGPENIGKLQNNLIFVQRGAKGEDGSYSQTYMAIDGGQIPITIVKSFSFVPIYQALDSVKRKIPARVLRLCKEQLYELVKSKEPERQLCVVDIDKIDKKDDLEFVVGVGTAVAGAGEGASEVGYQGISLINLFHDAINPATNYDAKKILEYSLPALGKKATYIPIFKYLSDMGIKSPEAYVAAKLGLEKHIGPTPAWYASGAYAKAFVASEKAKTAQEIVDTNAPEKAAIFLAFLTKDKFDLDIIYKFINANLDKLDNSSYATYFRKLLCLYDRYRYGWDDAVTAPVARKSRITTKIIAPE